VSEPLDSLRSRAATVNESLTVRRAWQLPLLEGRP
jgi:hypothetical protein